MWNWSGWRTIVVGAALTVLPPLVSYLLNVDWNNIVGANGAFIISGILTMVMRYFTTTPIGVSK